MKIGKLPNSLLEKIVIAPINKHSTARKEILLKPSVGEDCAALELGDNICLLSTDPITGAVEDIGRLAVNINTNDIASSGGEPVGIMVTALLPPDITENEISKIILDLYSEAEKVNVAILGGHTEITDAVNKPVLSCTVIGKTKRLIPSGGAKIGDSVIMTKYAAMEGTAIFANDKAEKLKGVNSTIIERAKKLSNSLSVIKEGNVGTRLGAHAMHDVTEGGILGACREIADCAGVGIEVYAHKIPVLEETAIICSRLGVNPLKLISSGSMLIVCENSEEMINALESEGIKATVIGKIVENDKIIINNSTVMPLEEPDTDELYRV
ncbi:MAG: AIR synthase family protein [Clostridia bacterium]|nr:AIR synthase family protein [Clostridia bacterium]